MPPQKRSIGCSTPQARNKMTKRAQKQSSKEIQDWKPREKVTLERVHLKQPITEIY